MLPQAVFEGGDYWPQTPARSLRVMIECGSEERAWGASEPSVCAPHCAYDLARRLQAGGEVRWPPAGQQQPAGLAVCCTSHIRCVCRVYVSSVLPRTWCIWVEVAALIDTTGPAGVGVDLWGPCETSS